LKRFLTRVAGQLGMSRVEASEKTVAVMPKQEARVEETSVSSVY
jgi:hypothetical protein